MEKRRRSRNILHPLALVVLVVFVLGLPAILLGITNGQPDGNGHPYVGIVVVDVGGQPTRVCSGSLIAPTVFLTAGHCLRSPAPSGARVWFDSTITDPNFPYGGGTANEAAAIHVNPEFCGFGCSPGLSGYITHDQGIIILSTPVTDKGFAVLPTQGLVDTLPMNTAVTPVGYGFQEMIPPHPQWALTRYFASSLLIQSNDVMSTQFVKTTANPAQGKGGLAFHDSGGPVLLGNIVLATFSEDQLGNPNFTGVEYSARVDTSDALAFIGSFL